MIYICRFYSEGKLVVSFFQMFNETSNAHKGDWLKLMNWSFIVYKRAHAACKRTSYLNNDNCMLHMGKVHEWFYASFVKLLVERIIDGVWFDIKIIPKYPPF